MAKLGLTLIIFFLPKLKTEVDALKFFELQILMVSSGDVSF